MMKNSASICGLPHLKARHVMPSSLFDLLIQLLITEREPVSHSISIRSHLQWMRPVCPWLWPSSRF